MKYYLDTEFLEGEQSRRFFGIKIGNTKPTIDLISVGLVSEDDREYYAISKDFNLYEAWNRYDINDKGVKTYWIRENVLKPIYDDLFIRIVRDDCMLTGDQFVYFNYYNMKELIQRYGKYNHEIADEIKWFIADTENKGELNPADYYSQMSKGNSKIFYKDVEIYTYYGDYDWVVFCWIFGKMIDLPKGFPMYSIDLKQILDDKVWDSCYGEPFNLTTSADWVWRDFDSKLALVKTHSEYPQQTNEHNALSDAHWNKKLHKFLIK